MIIAPSYGDGSIRTRSTTGQAVLLYAMGLDDARDGPGILDLQMGDTVTTSRTRRKPSRGTPISSRGTGRGWPNWTTSLRRHGRFEEIKKKVTYHDRNQALEVMA